MGGTPERIVHLQPGEGIHVVAPSAPVFRPEATSFLPGESPRDLAINGLEMFLMAHVDGLKNMRSGQAEDKSDFGMEADDELEQVVLELRRNNVGRRAVRRIVRDVLTRDPEHQTSEAIAGNIATVFYDYTLKFGKDIGGQPAIEES